MSAHNPDPWRSLIGRKGAYVSWGHTENRTRRTAAGRAAFEQKFLDQADGDPVRAEQLRKAYYTDLAIRSARARARRKKKPPTQAELQAKSRAAAAAIDVEATGGAA